MERTTARPVRRTLSLAAALGTAAAATLALSACGPVSPQQIASPTPTGSHLAATYSAAPETAEPSPSATATEPGVTPSGDASASPSAAAKPTATSIPTPAAGVVQRALGLEWADGAPVSAKTVALPQDSTPSGAATHTRVVPAEKLPIGVQIVGVTEDGHTIGLKDEASLVTLGKSLTPAPAVTGAPRSASASRPVVWGKGFVWTDSITSGGRQVDRVLAVDAVGGRARVLAQLPQRAVAEDAPQGWEVAQVFEDSRGVATLLLSAPPKQVGLDWASDYFTLPLAGGSPELAFKGATRAWGTAHGLFAERFDADGLGTFGRVERGKLTPILRSTDANLGGLPDSTDGTSVVLQYPSVAGVSEGDEDGAPVSLVLNIKTKQGIAIDARVKDQGDGSGVLWTGAVDGRLVTLDATRLYVTSSEGVAARAAVDLQDGPGAPTALWLRGNRLGLATTNIVQDLTAVFDLGNERG